MAVKNLHIYPSPFKNESRILREVQAILDLKLADEIILVGLWEDGLRTKEVISPGITLYRIKSFVGRNKLGRAGDAIRLFSFVLAAFFKFFRLKPSVINCHSLTVLPIGICYKLLSGAKVIYDAHELETERNGLSGISKKIAKMIERLFIHRADKTIVVGNRIALWYEKNYPAMSRKLHVVRNIPDAARVDRVSEVYDLKREFNISPSGTVFLYQGGLIEGRGIGILLDAFRNVPELHIVFMGYGTLQEAVMKAAASSSNIHYKEAVDPRVLLNYTRTADVGISLIENVCLSYYLCLPNKVFEYALSGLPVLVSDFPELKDFVCCNNIGWSITPDANELTAWLREFNRQELLQKTANVAKLPLEISWSSERENLKAVYSELI